MTFLPRLGLLSGYIIVRKKIKLSWFGFQGIPGEVCRVVSNAKQLLQRYITITGTIHKSFLVRPFQHMYALLGVPGITH